MTHPRLGDVLRETGVPDLVEILAERLTPPALEAVLREAHRQRAGRMTPAELLTRFERDPYVRPSPVPVSLLATIDRVAFSVAAPRFKPIELSPICPVGTVSALGPVDPGAARSAGGASEVVSDCASVLALECAFRRRDLEPTGGSVPERVELCASHRELHVPFSAPLRSEPHCRVFGLASAGVDQGLFRFETEALLGQLDVHLRLLESLREEGVTIGLIALTLFHRAGADFDRAIRDAVVAPLAETFPDVKMIFAEVHPLGRGYYAPLGFTVTVEDHVEVEHRVGLGGFTDWTRQLLDRSEERLLVSIIATERLSEVGMEDFPDQLSPLSRP